MPSGLDWFRLYNRMPLDPKVRSLSDAEFRILVFLWCQASASADRGKVYVTPTKGMSPKEICVLAGCDNAATMSDSEATCRLESLSSVALVACDKNGVVAIPNWDRLQYGRESWIRENKRKQKRKERARKKGPPPPSAPADDVARMSHGDVATGNGDSRTTDTDTDTDTEEKKVSASASKRATSVAAGATVPELLAACSGEPKSSPDPTDVAEALAEKYRERFRKQLTRDVIVAGIDLKDPGKAPRTRNALAVQINRLGLEAAFNVCVAVAERERDAGHALPWSLSYFLGPLSDAETPEPPRVVYEGGEAELAAARARWNARRALS